MVDESKLEAELCNYGKEGQQEWKRWRKEKEETKRKKKTSWSKEIINS